VGLNLKTLCLFIVISVFLAGLPNPGLASTPHEGLLHSGITEDSPGTDSKYPSDRPDHNLLIPIRQTSQSKDFLKTGSFFLVQDSWEKWGALEQLSYSTSHPGGIELSPVHGETRRQGVFTTKVLETEKAFSHLVPFWNVITPGDSEVIIEVRVKIADTRWTDWQQLGIWGQNIKSRSYSNNSSNQGYPFRVDIDIFEILHEARASHYQMRITLKDSSGSNSPVLTSLGATTYSHETEPSSTANSDWVGELMVPRRSQMLEGASIRNNICGPVCLAMVLEYLGHRESSSSVASHCYDHGAKIYGNWSFNVAYAGSLGYRAYINYFHSLENVKEHIARGNPVIASIRFGPGELKNSPINSTIGHLVVITGFKVDEDGTEWVIVNDPSAPDSHSVRREYLASEFQEAWIGIVYIIEKSQNTAQLKTLQGDLNMDGSTDVKDVIIAMRHILEVDILTKELTVKADINNDGEVNILDVVLIMQEALGIVSR
jgi:uncharacterized protein YvpB